MSFKLKSKNIRTIHNGVSTRFKSKMDTYELNKVKAKYKLPEEINIINEIPLKNGFKIDRSPLKNLLQWSRSWIKRLL